MLHFGQPTVKTQCDIYSTNRHLDTVYTRLRPDFTSNLVHGLAFGTPTFYIAPYGKIKHELVNLSSNCDVKSSLRLGHCGLGFHHPGNQSGLCPHCGDPEDPDHVFFDCESHIVHR